MAEGFANVYRKDKVKAFSAGIEPKEINPFALEVMGEKGIDIKRQRSTAFSEELACEMDYVITVCGNAEKRCPLLPSTVRRLHWPLEDPAQATGSSEEIMEVFRRSRDEIKRLVKEFLSSFDSM